SQAVMNAEMGSEFTVGSPSESVASVPSPTLAIYDDRKAEMCVLRMWSSPFQAAGRNQGASQTFESQRWWVPHHRAPPFGTTCTSAARGEPPGAGANASPAPASPQTRHLLLVPPSLIRAVAAIGCNGWWLGTIMRY